MLLSRIFSLMLGTTLFVMIWTMQDGDHSAPRVMAATDLRPVVRRSASETEMVETVVIETQPVAIPVAVVSTTRLAAEDPAMWIFATETAETVASK